MENSAKNQILYGPPGTGKTYSVVNRALQIVDEPLFRELTERQAPRHEWVEAYQRFVDEGRVRFCTFHQSYAYEDFVEGLRSNEAGQFVPQDGIFKEICQAAQALPELEGLFDKQTSFYKMSLGAKEVGQDVAQYCFDNNVIALGFGGAVNFTHTASLNGVKEVVEQQYEGNDKPATVTQMVHLFKHEMNVGDIVFVSYGNHYVQAIGRVVGEYEYRADSGTRYHQFRQVEWLYCGAHIPANRIFNRQLTQRTLYRLVPEAVNQRELVAYIGQEVDDVELSNYVLILDEINRGNIARILGELITLIEDDKRLGEANEMRVQLPYSRELFGVPSNLYIIGTMNTADRSITLMDTALRRRFEFVELLPDVECLPETIGEVELRKLVTAMNARIEYLYDRDHLLGHALFTSVTTVDELIATIQRKAIPLLQEYFYGDWEKIALVLGGASERDNGESFLYKQHITPQSLFPGQHVEWEAETRFVGSNYVSEQALYRIYQGM